MAKPSAKTKKKNRQPRGYSRVDSHKTHAHGWLVRIRRGGKMKSRFISDAAHGGKRKAQAVAAEVYANWSAEMPPMETCVDKMSVRNATGVVGVHFANDADSRYPNCSYESYIASWMDESGKRTKLGFSCNKYGKQAFELACIARENRLTDRDKVIAIMERRQKTPSSRGKLSGARKAAQDTQAPKPTSKQGAAKKKPAKKKPAKKKPAKKK